MRGILAFGVLLTAVVCLGQNAPSDLFRTVRPDLMIEVAKHSIGADDVTITTLAPNYPKELLVKQIESLGRLINSAPRGLSVENTNPIPGNSNTAALRAIFAVDGLIQRERSSLGLQPLAQAFADSAIKGKANVLMIQYPGEKPTNALLKTWSTPDGAVRLQAHADPQFGIEYRIKLETNDPAKIVIPEGDAAEKMRQAQAKPAEPKPQGPDWTMIVIIVVAALAVGALVYSLLLRPRPASPHK